MSERPSIHQTLMSIAQLMAARGTCQRLNVGAVIAHESHVLCAGYNGAPAGMPHCNHETDEDLFVVTPCRTAVHAEANAIAFAAKHGVRIEGSTLYTTHSPCMNCAFLVINSGIVKVIFDTAFRDLEPVNVLTQANIEVVSLNYIPD